MRSGFVYRSWQVILQQEPHFLLSTNFAILVILFFFFFGLKIDFACLKCQHRILLILPKDKRRRKCVVVVVEAEKAGREGGGD